MPDPYAMQGAAKSCNQLLAKLPNHPLLLVLKAYTFERQGEFTSAFKLVDTIAALGTDDDEVLHHVSNLLKTHGKHEQLLAVYQTSAAKHPANLGLQQETFLCHVRLGHVVQQQQVCFPARPMCRPVSCAALCCTLRPCALSRPHCAAAAAGVIPSSPHALPCAVPAPLRPAALQITRPVAAKCCYFQHGCLCGLPCSHLSRAEDWQIGSR